MTVYQMLRLLAAHGWQQKSRVGQYRLLEHPWRPGVYIALAGAPSRRLSKRVARRVLASAGIEEKPR